MKQEEIYQEKFTKRVEAAGSPDFEEIPRTNDEILEEARRAGDWPPDDALEGIEAKIKMARAINGLKTD